MYLLCFFFLFNAEQSYLKLSFCQKYKKYVELDLAVLEKGTSTSRFFKYRLVTAACCILLNSNYLSNYSLICLIKDG